MAQQQIPQEAYQLSEKYYLGMPTAVYRTQYTRADSLLFQSQLLFSLLTIGISLGFIVAFLFFHIYLAKIFLFVLIVLSALTFTNLFRSMRRSTRPPYVPFTRDLRVYMYEHGLVRLRTTKPDVIRWDEIRRVRCYTYQDAKGARGFQPFVTVLCKDGKSFRFGANITDVTLLGKTIEQECTKRKNT